MFEFRGICHVVQIFVCPLEDFGKFSNGKFSAAQLYGMLNITVKLLVKLMLLKCFDD